MERVLNHCCDFVGDRYCQQLLRAGTKGDILSVQDKIRQWNENCVPLNAFRNTNF
jgi:hypothetical protein